MSKQVIVNSQRSMDHGTLLDNLIKAVDTTIEKVTQHFTPSLILAFHYD